jgi:hypothetical protein
MACKRSPVRLRYSPLKHRSKEFKSLQIIDAQAFLFLSPGQKRPVLIKWW